jgi:hypothetical protein
LSCDTWPVSCFWLAANLMPKQLEGCSRSHQLHLCMFLQCSSATKHHEAIPSTSGEHSSLYPRLQPRTLKPKPKHDLESEVHYHQTRTYQNHAVMAVYEFFSAFSSWCFWLRDYRWSCSQCPRGLIGLDSRQGRQGMVALGGRRRPIWRELSL